jgi:hypothetical protein
MHWIFLNLEALIPMWYKDDKEVGTGMEGRSLERSFRLGRDTVEGLLDKERNENKEEAPHGFSSPPRHLDAETSKHPQFI